jgi:Putative adhesin
MKKLFFATAFLLTLAAAAPAAPAEEATFTRDLTVTGRVDLTVQTGSGSIHLTSGPAGSIQIVGRVKSNWGASGARAHEIADHPPIQQTGNIVRIGTSHENVHNVSIDYEIQLPPDALLNAATGSGDVTDDGVGANVRLSTGSGSIHATGLQGGFTISTGSGNIYAEQIGTGDVKADTGSGSIELKNLHGGLNAETGSGNIKAAGTPSAPWRLHTGSGSVEIWTGPSAFTLEAHTGSGRIHSDREISTQGTMERQHVTGKIAGGGPTVHIETGSGSIRIH